MSRWHLLTSTFQPRARPASSVLSVDQRKGKKRKGKNRTIVWLRVPTAAVAFPLFICLLFTIASVLAVLANINTHKQTQAPGTHLLLISRQCITLSFEPWTAAGVHSAVVVVCLTQCLSLSLSPTVSSTVFWCFSAFCQPLLGTSFPILLTSSPDESLSSLGKVVVVGVSTIKQRHWTRGRTAAAALQNTIVQRGLEKAREGEGERKSNGTRLSDISREKVGKRTQASPNLQEPQKKKKKCRTKAGQSAENQQQQQQTKVGCCSG